MICEQFQIWPVAVEPSQLREFYQSPDGQASPLSRNS